MHSWALTVLATWCYHSVSTGEIHIYLSIYTGVSRVFAIRFVEDMKIPPNAYTRTVEYLLEFSCSSFSPTCILHSGYSLFSLVRLLIYISMNKGRIRPPVK